MAVRGRPRLKGGVEVCIERYPLNPVAVNVFSTLSKTFIECYLESKTEDYISVFSRRVAEELMKAYSCESVEKLLQMLSKRLDEISSEIARRYWVYELRLTTTTRLLVHARGSGLPFEVSLAWDPILNVPFIPSSSIKGSARAYFEEVGISINGYSVDDIFGSIDREGLVMFTDAYPVACKRNLLEPEVVTPHYHEVKELIDEASSTPIPMVFITVSPGVTFRLLLIGVKTFDSRAVKQEVMDKVAGLVAQALSRGVGAKTSVGYGRFTSRVSRR